MSDLTTYSPDTKAYQLAEFVGDFDLTFDTSESLNHPDVLPWTLTFTVRGEEHHFGGQDLDALFRWALDYICGKVDTNGRPISTDPDSLVDCTCGHRKYAHCNGVEYCKTFLLVVEGQFASCHCSGFTFISDAHRRLWEMAQPFGRDRRDEQ